MTPLDPDPLPGLDLTTLASISCSGPWSPPQAAELLWNAGLGKEYFHACTNAYTEDVVLNLSDSSHLSGRNARSGRDSYAQQSLTQSWFDVTDHVRDSNEFYIEHQQNDSMKSIFDQATLPRGSLHAQRTALCSRMQCLDEWFDEDDFWDQVRDESLQLARSKGLDTVFDITPSLGGRCGTEVSYSFSLPRRSHHEHTLMVPDFCSANQSQNWAQALSFFNIHPADLANTIRAHVLSQLHHPDYFQSIGAQTPAERADIKRLTRHALCVQGLSRRVGRDPSTWSAGMKGLAQAWSSSGWSLPRDDSPPTISISHFVDILSEDTEPLDVLLTFSTQGSDLQSHSMLIDRFTSSSPVCAEPLASKCMAIFHADLTLNGVDVAFAGPTPIFVHDLSFNSDHASDSHLFPCMQSARSNATLARELSWLLRSYSHPGTDIDVDTSTHLEHHITRLSTLLGTHAIDAFSWALSPDSGCGNVSAEAQHLAYSGFEQGRLTAQARLARLGQATVTPPTRLARIDDFDVRFSGLMSAPWRTQVNPALAFKRDSLGNSLAHKAVACLDSDLLILALHALPSLSSCVNFAGKTPIDLIHHSHSLDRFIPLVCALLLACPEHANTRASNGRTFLDLAAARNLTPSDLTQLLDAGCSLSSLDSHGRAPWFHWVYKSPTELASFLNPAIQRGWDINQPDLHGRTLAHMVTRLESAQALLTLGIDFTRLDTGSRPGGCAMLPADFALLEAQILKHTVTTLGPRKRAHAL